jgi:hypothetical protein
LVGLCGVTLSTPVSLDYEVLGLVLDGFELGDIAVEFACIRSYELVAFPDLDGGC